MNDQRKTGCGQHGSGSPSIDLWHAPTRGWEGECRGDPVESLAHGILSVEERTAASKYVHEGARRRYVAGRILLRLSLSYRFGGVPAAWRLRRDERGRPEITGPKPLPDAHFSLSHSGDAVVCLVASGTGRVGVDVEVARRPIRRSRALAQRCCSEAERAWLAQLRTAERDRAFLELWTLKEAYAKAIGIGLGVGLSRVGFDLSEGMPPQAHFDPSLGDDSSRWRFFLLRPARDVVIAAAIETQVDRPLLRVHHGMPSLG